MFDIHLMSNKLYNVKNNCINKLNKKTSVQKLCDKKNVKKY
jgi:hypothetical protein